jgi:hypothetical protein
MEKYILDSATEFKEGALPQEINQVVRREYLGYQVSNVTNYATKTSAFVPFR